MMSEETPAKISAAKKGKARSAEHEAATSRYLRIVVSEGSGHVRYESAVLQALGLGIARGNITRV